MVYYTVKLENGVWVADWDGDPGRTTDKKKAKKFVSVKKAVAALKHARTFRPFKKATVETNLIAEKKIKPCEWKADDDGIYFTSCKNSFFFDTGGVKDNKFTHCPYCGRALEEVSDV
jgi:hypothetical protein